MTTTQNTKIGTTGTTEVLVHNRPPVGDVVAKRFYTVIEWKGEGELAKGMYRVVYSDVWVEMLGMYGFLRL